MPVKSRLIFAIATCLLLSNCGLIGTALRLAPYALLFADDDDKGVVAGKTVEMRGREVQDKGGRGILSMAGSFGSQVAFKR
ncbi:MAG: hypothetical protein B7Z37_06795 [Verrucomicrobia bacterium 12-59-8]|nr:MAG: hypothetical protein B7Z37_06795 [Verrucomicrobia bacterium 12-59-8]